MLSTRCPRPRPAELRRRRRTFLPLLRSHILENALALLNRRIGPLTHDEQLAELNLIVETAHDIWG